MQITRLVKKAQQSICKYQVAAMAFDHKGDLLGYSSNRPRFSREGGSIHAEIGLITRYKKRIHTIVIIRVNRTGELKPIKPCSNCAAVAKMLGIRIRSLA